MNHLYKNVRLCIYSVHLSSALAILCHQTSHPYFVSVFFRAASPVLFPHASTGSSLGGLVRKSEKLMLALCRINVGTALIWLIIMTNFVFGHSQSHKQSLRHKKMLRLCCITQRVGTEILTIGLHGTHPFNEL